MNNPWKLFKTFCVGVFLTLGMSCELTELDLTENPNALSPAQSDITFLLNGVQNEFGKFVANIEVESSEVTRMLNMDGRTYTNALEPSRFNPEWRRAYAGILNNIDVLVPLAEENGFAYHVGIAQVIKAYVIITLVDLFGDIPYSEALKNSENFNPKLDEGEAVYNIALGLLDLAIDNFEAKGVSVLPNDFFYGGNWKNWIKVANSIKMKAYVTKRLVDNEAITKFDLIVASGDFIATSADDFQFEWGVSNANPDVRNPRYIDDYTSSGSNTYMSNWLMNYMYSDKSAPDPRMKYYFYRQIDEIPQDEPNLKECVAADFPPLHYGNAIYCSLPEGYWGRDHGDDDGIPPDGQLRTAYGLYPVGGRFDDDSFKAIASPSLGAGGKGITPIMLASWVDIMRAEMALEGGSGDALTLLQEGVRKSFQKVRTFINRDVSADQGMVPSTTLDEDYLTELGQLFGAATTDGDKMDILGSEYFVALFGNGLDAFNFYRRTGRPSTLQPNLEENSGAFFRSFYYPSDASERNGNITQKKITDKVFWDTGTELLAN